MISLELAKAEEFGECMRILKEGKDFQEEQGFFQWDDDYLTVDMLKGDIENRKGYVVKIDNVIAGYLYADFDGDAEYEELQGIWRLQEPYLVIHRMAYDRKFRGQGLSTKVFTLLDDLCKERGVRYLRIDTHPENERMQHVLEKNGFVRCGDVCFSCGGRIAYDKILL